MQIISGIYKRKNILSPRDELTHPMGSREKNALSNMLVDYLKDAEVLDAFAGTGALGLECLSRGAKYVEFVEKSPKIASVLKKNVENVVGSLKSENVKITTSSVENFCTDKKFDIIIADPPYSQYSKELIEPLLKYLKEKSILIISIPKTATTPVLEKLELISRKTYASASILLFQKN